MMSNYEHKTRGAVYRLKVDFARFATDRIRDTIADDERRMIDEHIATRGVYQCRPGESSDDHPKPGGRKRAFSIIPMGDRGKLRQALGAHTNSREAAIKRRGGLLND